MKSLLHLSDINKHDVYEIFRIADDIQQGKYKNTFAGKTVVMFFPDSSIRTRVTFEKGVYLMGGQTVLFPPGSLDKKEDIRDVAGYLDNWADAIIVRHKDMKLLECMAEYSAAPVINAMTDTEHPCEILSDLYALSKIRDDITADKYLFVGADGNIGRTWREAAALMGFDLLHCCPDKHKMDGVAHCEQLSAAVAGRDIICTDSIPAEKLSDFSGYQITSDIMAAANDGAVLNPCPPFFRGEEVSAEVIESSCFVGYGFKKYLLQIQQAVLIWAMST